MNLKFFEGFVMGESIKLKAHLSPFSIWAFSLGTAVGWGSLVVTSNTYLVQAGPLGTSLGLLAGAVIMMLIGWNYAYMMRCYPEAGGAYAFTREVFGYDQGFLTAWFLAMTYLAVLWANATSLPLFSRIFLGGIFRFGRMYQIFGYDVYIGEAILSAAALLLIGFLCIRFSRVSVLLMTMLGCLFTLGIAVCFVAGIIGGGSASMAPAFVPDTAAISQIVKIAVISPWAFIGFESISHLTEEIDFERDKIRRIMMICVASTTVLYILVTLLSVTAYPSEYGSWLEYIRDLDHLEGIKALPPFYAAYRYMGDTGIFLLMLALLALVISSLIGNMTALSRLFYSMSKDRILPERFSRLNGQAVPANAIGLVLAISCLIPLVGRTAIGWIVDVTTIGATLIYGLVCACTARMALRSGDKRETWTGRIGTVLMICFGVYLLAPNLVAKGSMARETYFLFIIWTVLGFVFFRYILSKDREKRFGGSIIVWVALLSLVLFIALIWMRQSMIQANDQMRNNVREHYEEADAGSERMQDEQYIEEQMAALERADNQSMLMTMVMFGFALVIMMTNHSYMNRRSRESEMLANTDPMTGVKNKHAYLVKERELTVMLKEGRVPDFGIVVCDVNGLKKINDTYGHKAGDEYIRSACKMVCEIFSHSPVYRIGGDEFAVLLTGRDYDMRNELVAMLHDQSVDHIKNGGAVISGAVSEFRAETDTDVHEVFERADALMYEEKRLLKSLGAVTRDDESDAAEAEDSSKEGLSILNLRKHILIVEDQVINQELLGNALEEGYEILYASDGDQALEMIQEYRDELALVLLDLQMPKKNGMEVLRIVKADPVLKDLPIIVLTADQDAEVECLKAGAADFIPKPYPMWEIIRARVNKCIELSENRDLVHSTERDSVTRLFNTDYFLRYIRLHDQHYQDKVMDAIVLDVNHFHMINERYGKQYADGVLRRIGERVRLVARKIDGLGCRRGADTFLVYCPHRDDYTELLERFSMGLSGDGSSQDRVRLRMGVYSRVDKHIDIERRFDRAKSAADTVRGSLVNPIGIYDESLHESAILKERLIEDFRSSIAEECFEVYYQPKFDIRPDKPVLASAEALVRWRHPELGMVSPGDFIPLLEENGLILELDQYVWRKSAAQIRKWKDHYGYAVPVSVNVSRIDMLMPDLKSVFTQILEENGLTTEDIILEITESAYTGDSEQVISTARDLRGMGMGFRIEMDDFGTGYSSLGMLSNLPIDALKLDMTFVRSAFGENKDVRMIELIIDIASYLHVPVVAEGVETQEQYRVLKAMGCDLVQGYYFSKPVPSEEFGKFLEERGAAGPVEVVKPAKTYMSISGALAGEYEHIYYVDTVTDYYLEFRQGKNGELQILPAGENFFRDALGALIESAAGEDRGKIEAALKKESLMNWPGKDEGIVIPYLRKDGANQRLYCLQTIWTRGSDDHHVVIGVRPDTALASGSESALH